MCTRPLTAVPWGVSLSPSLPSPDDGKFSEATAVLLTWIDRGEVNRRTANHFYSMIQSANSHVRQLLSEKAQHEEEMELAKEHFKNAMLSILTQCKLLHLAKEIFIEI